MVVRLDPSWKDNMLCCLLNTISDCREAKRRRSGCSKQLSPDPGQTDGHPPAKIERNLWNSSHIYLDMTKALRGDAG